VNTDVGESMEFKFRQRIYRFGALCSLMVSVVSGVFGVLLLAGVVRRNHTGSVGGTILLAGFGFVVLLFSVLVFVYALGSTRP
jgi:hypothetical protein